MRIPLCLFAIALVTTLVACQGTYRDPFGGQLDWKFPNHPTPQEAARAFKSLEVAMKRNLKGMREGVESGNEEMVALAESNIEKIGEGKDWLSGRPMSDKNG